MTRLPTARLAAANRFYRASCAADLAQRLLDNCPSNIHGARLAAAAAAAAAEKALAELIEQLGDMAPQPRWSRDIGKRSSHEWIED